MKHKTPPKVELPPTPRTDAAFALRHTKTCSIAHFRVCMEQIEFDLIAALEKIEASNAKPPKPSPKSVFAD